MTPWVSPLAREIWGSILEPWIIAKTISQQERKCLCVLGEMRGTGEGVKRGPSTEQHVERLDAQQPGSALESLEEPKDVVTLPAVLSPLAWALGPAKGQPGSRGAPRGHLACAQTVLSLGTPGDSSRQAEVWGTGQGSKQWSGEGLAKSCSGRSESAWQLPSGWNVTEVARRQKGPLSTVLLSPACPACEGKSSHP